jgi:XTP/dITP diphosphohydrolase
VNVKCALAQKSGTGPGSKPRSLIEFPAGLRFNPAVIKLLIATRNSHKVGEIQAILGKGFSCQTLGDFPDAPAIVEDADTFAGNATKKATELARWLSGLSQRSPHLSPEFVIADDSGLEVDALGGAPGVHSARFAAKDAGTTGNSADADNNAKLLRLLQVVPPEKRTARFCCVIALVALAKAPPASFKPELFAGHCEGRIETSPRGGGGFGYDPLFVPGGYELSFAELGEDVKNRISHRAQALGKLHAHFAARR